MTGSRINKPNARTFPLEDLIDEVLTGGVRIPKFQRPFRWQWEDVKRLMDSIIRGYPIGSMLLWVRPAQQENLRIGALQINASSRDDALWVVDGQQRLTSLANALHDSGGADPRFAIAYNLSRKEFVKPVNEQIHVIGLPTVFDLQKLLKWFSKHSESAKYFEEATRIAKAIREYSIPAYIVKQEDEDVLRDIFDRMNNYGKRLTRAEVFSALHGGSRDDGSSHTLADIILNIGATYLFGEIDDDTVLRAILARRGPDVNRDIRAEFKIEDVESRTNRVSREFPNETPDQAYRAGEQALGRAVKFLQNEAGVPHFSFLSYRYLLVVLTRFFAYYPQPAPRNIELLRRWFWRAAIVGPEVFNGRTQAIRVLCSKIISNNEVQSVQSLLKAISEYPLKLPNLQSFKTQAASTRILLCAMWSQRPRSFLTGEPYLQDELGRSLEGKRTAKDIVATIRPKDLTPTANRFIFLEEDSVEYARDIFQQRPETMAESTWLELLISHAVDADMRMSLIEENTVNFLKLREAYLSKLTADFLSSMTETSFEDTPPLSSLIIDEDDEDDAEEFNEEDLVDDRD
ncbi:DUF262 domain-containing protein [Kovacikia minuta CCNUW1]|uniref:DUF262 domain-containing protein n=1 Tax=Kovacikia minuta TaxID=2931930 RepID=UPI001CCC6913|nr:DUF262 domain-containing protein [Kovacikia minuta]UBF25674.1 DUF262 domain-containing protein [Kovacikia minuta CCNUW1]